MFKDMLMKMICERYIFLMEIKSQSVLFHVQLLLIRARILTVENHFDSCLENVHVDIFAENVCHIRENARLPYKIPRLALL